VPGRRLTVVTDTWDPDGGGRERYLADLLPRLAARGIAVDVLCRRAQGAPVAGVGISTSAGLRWPRWWGELQFAAAVRRAHRGAATCLAASPTPVATHVQLHAGLHEDAFEAEARSAGPRAPWFRLGTRLNVTRQLRMRAERAMMSRAPRVMAWSRATARRVHERHGLVADVEPPGIDLQRFTPAGTHDGAERPLRLLFVAHNPALKGLRELLDGLAVVRAAGVAAHLTVLGRVARGLAGRAGEGEVTFRGAVGRDVVAQALRDSDALVHPTHYDPFSLVALEALASGRPVVTTRANGASEWIEAGRHGFLLERPDDHGSLLAALRALCDPGRRRAMAADCVTLAQRFDMDGHAGRVGAWLGLAA
jgi:glycosyltransferase involved in cell wall biosynthesis